MSIFGLIAALVMLLVLAWYVLQPMLLVSDGRRAAVDRQRERALAYYERVLTNIRDLDEDHVTGKIATAEYTEEREIWVQRGIKLLKLLDALDSQQTIVDSSDDADIDSAIEAAVAAQRQKLKQEAS